ncbi:MAG TPA: glycogen/starch/alpha-glucan phosphorylase [Candidatus Olsenella pullicola]|nr:glycogen/starch/alpha-glucan phosphorylase [Candidatus Olsenella pullicola]
MTNDKIFETQQDFIEQYREECVARYGTPFEDLADHERFFALAELIANKGRAIFPQSHPKGAKKVYYFSLEFLLGPLLDNYLINFGIRDLVADGIKEMGSSLEELCRQEVDPGLGNGGLGRLAACFLDSMAHEGIAGYGNGMRYRYGLFRQYIEGGRQVERTDNWLANGFPWETRKDGSSVLVRFGGQVVRHEENGKFWFTQEGGEIVRAVPYDVPIIGYGGKVVNKLRLWSAEPYTEDFDLDAFNAGDYARANKFRSDVEAISTILYPNDAGEHGRMLRLTCRRCQVYIRNAAY